MPRPAKKVQCQLTVRKSILCSFRAGVTNYRRHVQRSHPRDCSGPGSGNRRPPSDTRSGARPGSSLATFRKIGLPRDREPVADKSAHGGRKLDVSFKKNAAGRGGNASSAASLQQTHSAVTRLMPRGTKQWRVRAGAIRWKAQAQAVS